MWFFGKTFKFSVENVKIVHVPKHFIIENILDFDHVNYVHRRCYAYCRVIARDRGVTLLEYGVYHLPRIPLVSHYVMYHVYLPPDTVVHYAKSGRRGPWTKVTIHVEEIETESGPATRYTHAYERMLPVWAKPLTPLLMRFVRWWTDILWEEDRALVERRHALSARGFSDAGECAEWVFENGTGAYRFLHGAAARTGDR